VSACGLAVIFHEEIHGYRTDSELSFLPLIPESSVYVWHWPLDARVSPDHLQIHSRKVKVASTAIVLAIPVYKERQQCLGSTADVVSEAYTHNTRK